MSVPLLRTITPDLIPPKGLAFDSETTRQAGEIVTAVRELGDQALREYAERLDGLPGDQPLIHSRPLLEEASRRLPDETRDLLERTADRIRRFAQAQRNCLTDLTLTIPGGAAGHTVLPVEAAGCYAPGGRFPLPSSVLMTVIPARVAGVQRVLAASPRPGDVVLAAAAIAGADAVLAAGGAHAIAALAYGTDTIPACDVVVGPGNRWVTAAKRWVAGDVRIDMLAGPSELAILADESANPAWVAADLFAQAEHDVDARAMLIATTDQFIEAVNLELTRQIADLPTADTARAALAHGFALLARDTDQAIELCDRLAPEHVELHLADAADVAKRLRHYGCVFIGAASAEVFGDYGAGPNHTLPTGGTARYASGLSVFDFLRRPTWLHIGETNATTELAQDAAALARLEQLAAHERSATIRR
jgi:phosphoribosyl-ATP pyrophosphohydrolase/phosphoribosyl-AMP cyclohydrolase/histidinol dehydrogenase